MYQQYINNLYIQRLYPKKAIRWRIRWHQFAPLVFSLGPFICNQLHNVLLLAVWVLGSNDFHLRLDKQLVVAQFTRGRSLPRCWFGLLQYSLATTTSVFLDVDALGVALILTRACCAAPYVFEVNLIRMFGGNLDALRAK